MASPSGDARPAGDERPVEPVPAVFFGSGEFGVPILDALIRHPRVVLTGVVAAPDRPAGRGGALTAVPVAARARELDLPLLEPARLRDPAFVEALRELRPELGVLADFGRLVPPAVLELPSHGFLNVHPSLLPRHRGAAPVAGAILEGDRETGVTLMQMDAGLDTGPVVAADRWRLNGNETAPELEARAAEAGARLLERTLSAWLDGEVRPAPQDGSLATLTRPLRRADGWVDGSRPAADLARRVRAFEPWPGTYLDSDGGRVAILRAAVAPSAPGDEPGILVADDGGVALATVDGRLRLLDVQPAGGRRMSGDAWRRGRHGLVGTVVRPAGPTESP
jgi:methionyl-tRNA formyltransferase